MSGVARISLWALSSAAFGVAEVLTAADPLGAEPISLLLGTILLYGLVGASAGAVWHLGLMVFGRWIPAGLAGLLRDRWLALLPAGVLLLPKGLIAFRAEPVMSAVVGLSALAFAVLMSRLLPDSSIGSLALDGLTSVAFWTLLLRWKDVARIAEEKTRDVALAPESALAFALVAVSAALAAAVAVRFGRRSIAWLAGGLFIVTSLFRLLQSPSYDLDLKPAKERLGRGTPVILIVLDTTRADHLSLYGYDRSTTPELQELAGESLVFDRAISTSSWTLPAHASLFTGLHPLAHGAMRLPGLGEDAADLAGQGIHRPAYPLSEDFDTLAEWFQDAGYSTGAVIANYAYMDPAFQVDQGFEDYFAVRNTPVEPRLLKVIHRRIRPLPEVARHWQVYRDASQINELALEWLESRENHRFFLFLNYMEAHLPWGPHQPGLRYEQFAAEPELPERPGGTPPPEERFRRRVDLYDSNIASMDAELGRLFDRLREMGLFDRSLIVITSDHGESFGENAFDGHGKSLNEAEIRIPLLIKYPESKHQGRDFRRVHLVDVPPTITHILGQDLRGKGGRRIDGRPLTEPGAAPAETDEPIQTMILAELYTDPREPAEVFHGYRAALYHERLKLVVRSDGQAQLFREEQGLEQPVETPEELRAWVDEQVALVLDRYRVLEKAAKARQSEVELDPEVAAGLEALGYI